MSKLLIFDLDGTLTESGQTLSRYLASRLEDLLEQTTVAVISGATLEKIKLQILSTLSTKARLPNLILLPQNGTYCFEYRAGRWNKIYSFDLDQKEKEQIFAALEKIYGREGAAITYPPLLLDKGGQITYSPVGITAPLEAKKDYDADHRKREKIVAALRPLLPEFEISIGGLSSIDITRKGLNKALGVSKILSLKTSSPNEAVFVGDALFEGGNDNPIRTTGIKCLSVRGPRETAGIINQIVFDLQNEGKLLEKTDHPFEHRAVLNPSCVEKDGLIHMFYRAIADDNISSIGYCTFRGQELVSRRNQPLLYPEFDYESRGLEDPEIMWLDGTYYLFYTAYDGQNARVACATSRDLVHFEKKGLISPSLKYSETLALLNRQKLPEKYFWYGQHYQEVIAKDILLWEKDFSLFPRKIGDHFALLHRVMPGIQLISFADFADLKDEEFWKNHFRTMENNIVLNPESWFESRKIGGGAPPLETRDGWLLIYHAVEDSTKIYRAGAALLDLDDPRKVIGRLEEPLFSPEEDWEKKGLVNNVVFPSAALRRGDRLWIYYGAADNLIAAKSLDLNKLLATLKNQKL